MNRPLSDADLVTFVLRGCNAAEIAAYAGVDSGTAVALMFRARQQIASAPVVVGPIPQRVGREDVVREARRGEG